MTPGENEPRSRAATLGLSLRRLADTNKDNPERRVRLSFLG